MTSLVLFSVLLGGALGIPDICSENDCTGKGACALLLEDGTGRFEECEVDPEYFTDASVCEGDTGVFCEEAAVEDNFDPEHCTEHSGDPWGTHQFVTCCEGLKECKWKNEGWEYRCQPCDWGCPDDQGYYDSRPCSETDGPQAPPPPPPTNEPTREPTPMPTPPPTDEPTREPTEQPTKEETPAPDLDGSCPSCAGMTFGSDSDLAGQAVCGTERCTPDHSDERYLNLDGAADECSACQVFCYDNCCDTKGCAGEEHLQAPATPVRTTW